MPIFDSHAYLEGYPLPGVNQNAAQVAESIRMRGIDGTVLLSTRAAKADPLTGNRILRVMLEQGQGLYGCLIAHLNRVDASLQAIRDMMGYRRFVSIMLTSNDPREPLHPLVADELLNACRRYQKPIYLYTLNAASVEVALNLARTYSMHKFVFIGMGGSDWRTAIAAAQQSVNITLETSGSLDRVKIPAACDALGSHRVLFGSGSPHLDAVAALGLLEDSDLSEIDRRRMLFDNAAKLFNLSDIEDQA